MSTRWAAVGGAAIVAAPLALVGLLLTVLTATGALLDRTRTQLDLSSLPPLASQLAPQIQQLIAKDCPDLPLPWALAIPEVESSWNPAAYNPRGRAAGLYQLTEPSWTEQGGRPWTPPPTPDDEIFQPEPHVARAIPLLCANLRTITGHLAATGKPTDLLDALLVCHVAGCGRVLNSRTGIPAPGDADCNATCAATVRTYISDVHSVLDRITRPAGPVRIDDLPHPAPYTGPSNMSCNQPDPSGHGCLTPVMRHALDELEAAFGPPGNRNPIRALSCWDAHAWNPTSDHPHGRACDLFPTNAGTYPTGAALAEGWRIATWLRANAAVLHVRYLIWQGRYWSATTIDSPGGWGVPYDGGGIYDPHDATGGHFDHVHVSVTT